LYCIIVNTLIGSRIIYSQSFKYVLNSPSLYNFTNKTKSLFVQAIGVYGRDLCLACSITCCPGIRCKLASSFTLYSIICKNICLRTMTWYISFYKEIFNRIDIFVNNVDLTVWQFIFVKCHVAHVCKKLIPGYSKCTKK